jgi:hypothetical protein
VTLLYPHIIAVEEDILAALKADAQLAAWRANVTQVPGLSKAKELAELFRTFPAVGTYAPDGQFHQTDPRLLNETCPLWIICAGQNLRSPHQPSRGDDRSPGSLHLVNRCVQIILAWECKGNLKSINPKDWRLTWCNKSIAVHALQVEVVLTRPKAPTTEEIETYGSSYS